MQEFTTTITDDYGTKFALLVKYDVLERDPDVGLMSEGADVQEVICYEVIYHKIDGSKHSIENMMELGCTKPLDEKWMGGWCLDRHYDLIDALTHRHVAGLHTGEYD